MLYNVCRRLLVYCSDGVRKSGMFCCATIIIDKLNDEEEVDIFSTVKSLRRSNPKFIINARQYKCLHDIVCRYLGNAEVYGATDVTYV